MATDVFFKEEARDLLRNKSVYFFGDSNMRALYKDFVWLLEFGSLIPDAVLKRKNEETCAGDSKVSNSDSNNGLTYEETRVYCKNGACLQFDFLTRVFQDRFTRTIEDIEGSAVLIINSCLWDITRYGPESIDDFKSHLTKLMEFLKGKYPRLKVLWTTTLPPGLECKGGFLNGQVELIQTLLPFHVNEANAHIVEFLKDYSVDIIDFHYHLKFLIDYREEDGIHWKSEAVRFMTNFILTHLTICWNLELPGRMPLAGEYSCHYSETRMISAVKGTLISTSNWKRKARPFQDWNGRSLQDRNAYPFQDGKAHPFQDENMHPFQDRNVYPFQDENMHPFQDRNVYPFQDENMHPFQDRNVYPFRDENMHPFQDRNVYPFQDRNTHPFQDRYTYPFQDWNRSIMNFTNDM